MKFDKVQIEITFEGAPFQVDINKGDDGVVRVTAVSHPRETMGVFMARLKKVFEHQHLDLTTGEYNPPLPSAPTEPAPPGDTA